MNGRRKEHEPATVWRAQELYCADRLTFDAVAQATGVAVSTLKRWSDKYDWQAKRSAIAEAEADIRADTVLARAKMLKELISTANPQVGFAVAGLEALAMRQAEADRRGRRMDEARTAAAREVDLADPSAVAEALREAVRRRLARQVCDGVDLAGVKEILQALDLIARLEPKRGEDDAPIRRPLSEENAELIRRVLTGEDA